MSVLSDGIGDRDIPGATARELVDVSFVKFCPILFIYGVFADVYCDFFFWCLVMENE